MRNPFPAAANRFAVCSLAAALIAAAASAAAQDYPIKPIRLIVPTAASGGTDIPSA